MNAVTPPNDPHDPDDFDNAYNMVQVENATPAEVVEAAKRGRSYATTGLLLVAVDEADGRISIEVDAPCAGAFIGPGGQRLETGEGTHFAYAASDEAYVRFEAEGGTGRIFLQPMFKAG